MYENVDIQMVADDFSRRREQELYISRTFVRLNVLDTNGWSDRSVR